MLQHLLRWLLALGVTIMLLVPQALAQTRAAPAENRGGHTGTVILSSVLAIVATLLIAAILCTPSRKRARA
jgi:hypothetical protein